MKRLVISPEVSDALRAGVPVVALESAVITSGMPRTPLGRAPSCEVPGWRDDLPTNLEVARLLPRIVRAGGAIPATIAVLGGELRVGLDDDQLIELAGAEEAGKVSVGSLAAALASGATAGTTVSATLVACGRVGPIRVFATGGIGGVHRDWRETADISADLDLLATTQTCVVSAGAKSILDLPATLQRLETRGVPVVGYRTDSFPRFHALGDASLPMPLRLDEPAALADLCLAHWLTLGRPGGVLAANPVPVEHALEALALEKAIQAAEKLARKQGVTGPARTPFLLSELNKLTDGRTLDANIALLANNAGLAAEIALAMRGRRDPAPDR